MNNQLIDTCNRRLNYLRISITDRCNLKCRYCQPFGGLAKLKHSEILRYEEIIHLTRIAARLGIEKVRITGGEPLVRKGVYSFLDRLAAIDGLQEISLTTNGVSLRPNLRRLYDIGLRRINVSLDTLDAKKFHTITGRDLFQDVWSAIIAAHEMGFAPIKINAVALAGVNDDEILDFARLTYQYPFHVRFIEYMPMGAAAWTWKQDRTLLTPDIKKQLAGLGPLQALPSQTRSGPATCYQLQGALGQIGFISALSHHFCRSCNRLRLTASGKLRPCLLADNEIDIKKPLRAGASDAELANCFFEAVRLKQTDHHLQASATPGVNSPMSGIGG